MRRYGYPLEQPRGGLVERLAFASEWPSQAARMFAWMAVEAVQHRFPRRLGRRPGARMILDPEAVG